MEKATCPVVVDSHFRCRASNMKCDRDLLSSGLSRRDHWAGRDRVVSYDALIWKSAEVDCASLLNILTFRTFISREKIRATGQSGKAIYVHVSALPARPESFLSKFYGFFPLAFLLFNDNIQTHKTA